MEVIESAKLVYVGKIICIEPIVGADFISSATVICGEGGKWKGIIKKNQFDIDDLCLVYLPDALIPPNEGMKFMEASNWRVRMRRFKGVPSEVLIVSIPETYQKNLQIGDDLTLFFGVTKYHKPLPANLQGKIKGEFPPFIPKTDEPNYQTVQDLVDALVCQSFFITEKADGSSTTAYKYKGNFGVCSRNWELERDQENGYWKIALQHNLEEKLPEGYAIQWETCGPKIQSNPMGFTEITGLAFSVYNIEERRYLIFDEFVNFCEKIKFPMVNILIVDDFFDTNGIESLGEGTYNNGKQREGVVVRSTTNHFGHKPISFKVINLGYEK